MENGAGHWFERQHGDELDGPVAYFCAEYGLHESLGIYSGGLGVLAGDHLQGRLGHGPAVRRRRPFLPPRLLPPDHRRRRPPGARLPRLRPGAPAAPARRRTTTAGRSSSRSSCPAAPSSAAVWLAQVGRVPLLLLDTDIPDNDDGRPAHHAHPLRPRPRDAPAPGDGAGRRRRARAARAGHRARGLAPQRGPLGVHARRAGARADGGRPRSTRRLDAGPARRGVHHPHAGLGRQRALRRGPRAAARRARWSRAPALDIERILELGRGADDDHGQFDMTAFSLRLTTRRQRRQPAARRRPPTRTWQRHPGARPILGITNGVHPPTWVGGPIRRAVRGHRRPTSTTSTDERHQTASGSASTRSPTSSSGRRTCARSWSWPSSRGAGCSTSSRATASRHASSTSCRGVLDPNVLTIGFARRFATYKRAALLFSDEERLARLLWDAERPVQIVFAGKAHPADRPGQRVIQDIFERTPRAQARGPRLHPRGLRHPRSRATSSRASTSGSTTRAGRSRRPAPAA